MENSPAFYPSFAASFVTQRYSPLLELAIFWLQFGYGRFFERVLSNQLYIQDNFAKSEVVNWLT